MNSVAAVLPYPPTTNNAYAVQRGRLVKTDDAREYATDVTERLFEQPEWRKFKRNLTGSERFSVIIVAHPPDRRRRDIANVEKLVTDAMFKFIEADDSRIDRLLLERAHRVPDGQLVVTITTLEEANA